MKFLLFLLLPTAVLAQLKWKNVDSLFQPLPASVHVYYTNDSLDGKPNISYYATASLKDQKLDFMADTTLARRITPNQFFKKNNSPIITVNSTFFEFKHNKNVNTVIKNKKIVGYNIHSFSGKGKDSLTYMHPFTSAIGINKKRQADVAWIYTDSSLGYAYAMQQPVTKLLKDSLNYLSFKTAKQEARANGDKIGSKNRFKKWKMTTAVGGGPVMIQNGQIQITNNQEMRFSGNTGLTDKHPRTCMGYTQNGQLIILVVQGRFKGIAEGASLQQAAKILQNLGCVEALNLDGGGSSCMLINGKETIKPSDKEGQRPVPCVFIIK